MAYVCTHMSMTDIRSELNTNIFLQLCPLNFTDSTLWSMTRYSDFHRLLGFALWIFMTSSEVFINIMKPNFCSNLSVCGSHLLWDVVKIPVETNSLGFKMRLIWKVEYFITQGLSIQVLMVCLSITWCKCKRYKVTVPGFIDRRE